MLAGWAVGLLLAIGPLSPARGGALTLDPSILSGRRWGEGARRYRQELLELARAEEIPPAKPLADAYARYSLCDLLAKAKGVDLAADDDGHDLIDWLMANPELAGTLALALRPGDDPKGVLTVLRVLMLTTHRKPVKAPDLYVAFAIVWDREVLARPNRPYTPGGRVVRRGWRGPAPQDPHAPEARLKRFFTYLVGHRDRMSSDPATLPWQYAAFVVDCPLAEAERFWALKRYARSREYGALYGMINYDIEHSKWEPNASYTLENIRRWGGVCSDRSYFTANVAKACGRPAAIISGMTRSGVGHAWVMILSGDSSGRFGWNIHGWNRRDPGDYTEPQTGRRLPWQEALLRARAMRAPYAQRLAGDTYVRVAQLFREEIEPQRTLDFLRRATQANPYDTRTWLILADMMSHGETASDRATALYVHLLERFRRYPEFTRDILRALVPLIPDDEPAKLCRLYQATFKVYRGHHDIVAELMTELGDFLRERGKPTAALATYRELIHRYRAEAHLVQKALAAAEALCREQKKLAPVIEMYEDIFVVYRRKKGEALFYGKSAYYYRFAQKLAALCREAGNVEKARRYERLCARIDEAMRKRAERQRKRGHR